MGAGMIGSRNNTAITPPAADLVRQMSKARGARLPIDTVGTDLPQNGINTRVSSRSRVSISAASPTSAAAMVPAGTAVAYQRLSLGQAPLGAGFNLDL